MTSPVIGPSLLVICANTENTENTETFDQSDTDVGLVSVHSSRPGESTDMQYDPFRSSRDLGLT